MVWIVRREKKNGRDTKIWKSSNNNDEKKWIAIRKSKDQPGTEGKGLDVNVLYIILIPVIGF